MVVLRILLGGYAESVEREVMLADRSIKPFCLR